MKKYLLSIFALLLPFLTIAQEVAKKGWDERINDWFSPISNAWSGFVFTTVTFPGGVTAPIVIIWLVVAGTLFTVLFKFINIRLVSTSFNILRGKYDALDHHEAMPMVGDLTPGDD